MRGGRVGACGSGRCVKRVELLNALGFERAYKDLVWVHEPSEACVIVFDNFGRRGRLAWFDIFVCVHIYIFHGRGRIRASELRCWRLLLVLTVHHCLDRIPIGVNLSLLNNSQFFFLLFLTNFFFSVILNIFLSSFFFNYFFLSKLFLLLFESTNRAKQN